MRCWLKIVEAFAVANLERKIEREKKTDDVRNDDVFFFAAAAVPLQILVYLA